MDKRRKRLVLAVTVVVLVMMPVKVGSPGADPALAGSFRQGDDRVPRAEWTCGGWHGRPCNNYDEVWSPAARDAAMEGEVARWLDHWASKGGVRYGAA